MQTSLMRSPFSEPGTKHMTEKDGIDYPLLSMWYFFDIVAMMLMIIESHPFSAHALAQGLSLLLLLPLAQTLLAQALSLARGSEDFGVRHAMA